MATRITPQRLVAVTVGIQHYFDGAYESGVTPLADLIAATIESDSETEEYPILPYLARLKEWKGERDLRAAQVHDYQLTHRDWQDGFVMRRNDILFDKYRRYEQVIMDLGRAAKLWPEDMVISAIQNGKTEKCFDGLPFFHASHKVNPFGEKSTDTYSNLFTGSGSVLNAANFATIRTAMRKYKGMDGRSMRIGANGLYLFCSPDLEDTANSIVKRGKNDAGADNVQMDQAKVKVIEDLADEPNAWYLADLSRPIKPIILQIAKRPNEIVSQDDPSSDSVFQRKEFRFGVDSIGQYGYSLPQLMVRCVGA